MTIATGIAKRVKFKKEVTWNVVPAAASSQALRRVSSTLELEKDTYQSAEIRADYQVVDYRHGVRRVRGPISGELSPGTYKDFLAAFVRQAFAAVTAISGLSVTIAGSGPTYTVTRAAGSFISDGIKAGDVVRLTAGAFNAANLNKNLFVISEIAAALTVIPVNGVALVAEGPIAAATVSYPGKKAMVPSSGFTDDSFSIEHWQSDIAQSEVFSGCKIDTLGIKLPPTGMAGIDFGFMGANVTTASAEYFTSPTAETTSGILAAVNGVLMVQGVAVGLLTGLNINGKGNMSAEPVVGQNTFADITEGRIEVDGDFTVLFQDATFRDYFLNETEVAIYAVLSASSAAAAEFVAFSLPRVKLGGAGRDDGEKALTLSCPFTALRNINGGAATSSEDTTFKIQDSLA